MSDSEYSEPLDVNGQDENDDNNMHMQLLQQQQPHLTYGSSSSSGESSISTTSSDESDENESEDALELTKINNQVLKLPRGLCENVAIFHEFFSLETWQELPIPVQNHLHKFLPRFNQTLPPQMAAVEQTRTISMLFENNLKRFGESPLKVLQQQLEVGNCRPDIIKLRENIKKSRRREQRFQHCERLSQIAKTLFLSRQRLLDIAYKSSPDTIIKQPEISHNIQKPKTPHLFNDNKLSAIRARKRFYSEISQIAQKLGFKEDLVLSADEEDDNALEAQEIKKLQTELGSLEKESENPKSSNSLADRCIYSTIFKKYHNVDNEDAFRLQQKTQQLKLTNRNFKEYLREHKRRKITEPTLPEFETCDIRLRDVYARAQMGGNFKRTFAIGKTPGRKPKLTLTATIPVSTILPSSATNARNSYTSNTTTTNITATKKSTATQPLILKTLRPPLSLPPPLQSAIKLSEPPALVPIQPTPKKAEPYQIVVPASKLPQKEYHQQMQHQLHVQQHSLAKLNKSINSNDSLNITQLMSVGNHTDNLNLCIDDSSLLTGDHDAFSMLDNEVELQQEEVETFGSTCEETIPAFVIGNDVVMTSNESNNDNKSSLFNATVPHQSQQQMEKPVPKLEPISRAALINTKTSTSITASTASNVSELIQETHACYFSLIRDFFCSTPNHRMRYEDLRKKIDVWLRNPITALNEWYSLAENWSHLLKSAINFLVGEFPNMPDEYVPYIEHKVQLNIYQWIGAGRDSDNRLTDLCILWMEKRHQPHNNNTATLTRLIQTELKLNVQARSTVENEDSHDAGSDHSGGLTPPPPLPRCPTNWTVRAATSEEIKEFQRQERNRFEQPHKAYTYRMHGYESVVGPVKGIYTPLLALSKARGHSMMVGDRPNFVTILTLVRDATARLPNGEGTRAEISELLKCSQYINRDASENVLQTIVSGALDRMHTEHDPCVRYDPKRKIWIYLHRNRSENEFERIHQQNQTIGKAKKLPQRKPKSLINTTEASNDKIPYTADSDNFCLLTSAETSNGSSANVTASLLTMPALVPSNPIVVANNNKISVQRQQQVLQRQQTQIINPNKSLPVPPLKYNIPPPQTSSPQQQQQKSLLKTTVRTETKTAPINNTSNIIKQHSFKMQQSKSGLTQNTTPIIVATPHGLQTVHVSNATTVMPAQSSSQQQQQHTANLAGKKVALNKPIIINQITTTSPVPNSPTSANSSICNQKLKSHQQQLIQKTQLVQNRITLQTSQHQLLTQQQQQSNLIIPVSMANNMTLSHSTTSNVTDVSNTTKQSNISGNSQSPVTPLSNKQSIIRLVPASNVKTLISSQSNTTQIVSRQRVIKAGTERPNIPQQQQKPQTTGLQLLSSNSNILTVSGCATTSSQAGSIVKMSPQQFASLQQKQAHQQQQHIIVKQAAVTKAQAAIAGSNRPQRLIVGNTSIVGQTGQGRNIVLQQIPVASSSIVVTPSQTSTISSNATTISGNKIQTINAKNLTLQQQRILIQNLKQQQQNQQTLNQNQIQFKTVQVVGNTSASQASMAGRAQTVNVATAATQQNAARGAVVVVSQGSGTTQQQAQQTVTRILKTTSAQVKSEMTTSSAGTRVISSSSGQIISLDSLIQKRGGTLRISGTGNATQTLKTNQQHVTANLQKSQQQQQQVKQQQPQQFAIVSVPNSIISLGSSSNFTVGQRIITTQAGSSNANSPINLDTTKVTPSVVSTGTGRVITATAAGTKIITKQAPTTAAATSNIRVISAVNQTTNNINLTTLHGKQVVLTTGKALNTISKAQFQTQQQQQNVQNQHGSIFVGGQTIKLQQGNTNFQQLPQKSGNIITSQSSTANLTTSTSPQLQTVIMGNQILRVQQLPQIVATANRINVSNTTKAISNSMDNRITATSTSTPKTFFVGPSGQTLRLQPASSQAQTITNKNIVQTQQQNTAIKTASNENVTTPNRVVLAVQGGGQIFLSPNFQGGNINLKSLQNMKVVPLAQHSSAKVKDISLNSTSTSSSSSSTILKITSTTPTTNTKNV